jgi:sulfite reductase (ferredoxin)
LEKLGDLSIHVSGCPNSCGRHPIASIGFSGGARRVDDRSVPYYSLHLGGRLEEGKTRLGTAVGAIPARNAPALVRNLLAAWQASPEADDFHRFVDNGGQVIARKLLDEHGQKPLFKPDEKFFYDWDAGKPFTLAGRGAGECSAGVFDLIEVDLANAREALEAGRLYVAALAASRALLITQSLKAKNDAEVFEHFQSAFIGQGLVDAVLAGVVAEGLGSAASPEPESAFAGSSGDVTTLVATVRVLYENLDSSLRFKPAST